MRTVYANQFTILPNHDITINDLFEDINSKMVRWVEGKYSRTWRYGINLLSHKGFSEYLVDHEVSYNRQQNGEFNLISLDWTHPDDEDSTLQWKTNVMITTDGKNVEITCLIRLSSTQMILKPIRNINVGQPRFIVDVLTTYDCYTSGMVVGKQLHHLTLDDVYGFVQDVLLSEHRKLPIILISEDARTGETRIDPQALVIKTIGLAEVAIIEKEATFELTSELGTYLSCFDGAVRIYWPGFKRSSSPRFHPIFFKDYLQKLEHDDVDLEGFIFKQLSEIAAVRLEEGPVTRRVRSHFDLLRVQQQEELKSQIKNHLLSQGELETELLVAWGEVDILKEHCKKLEEDKRRLELNLREVLDFQNNGDFEEDLQPTKFSDVWEAVIHAEHEFKNLCIWETAKDSAEDSQFGRPSDVYEALKAISELCDTYFRSIQLNQAMGSWESFFENRGIKYAHTESQNTLNMYGDERFFKNKGIRQQMLRHLTLGGGDRENCLQIYFEINKDERIVDIGYCGVHLEYYGMRT